MSDPIKRPSTSARFEPYARPPGPCVAVLSVGAALPPVSAVPETVGPAGVSTDPLAARHASASGVGSAGNPAPMPDELPSGTRDPDQKAASHAPAPTDPARSARRAARAARRAAVETALTKLLRGGDAAAPEAGPAASPAAIRSEFAGWYRDVPLTECVADFNAIHVGAIQRSAAASAARPNQPPEALIAAWAGMTGGYSSAARALLVTKVITGFSFAGSTAPLLVHASLAALAERRGDESGLGLATAMFRAVFVADLHRQSSRDACAFFLARLLKLPEARAGFVRAFADFALRGEFADFHVAKLFGVLDRAIEGFMPLLESVPLPPDGLLRQAQIALRADAYWDTDDRAAAAEVLRALEGGPFGHQASAASAAPPGAERLLPLVHRAFSHATPAAIAAFRQAVLALPSLLSGDAASDVLQALRREVAAYLEAYQPKGPDWQVLSWSIAPPDWQEEGMSGDGNARSLAARVGAKSVDKPGDPDSDRRRDCGTPDLRAWNEQEALRLLACDWDGRAQVSAAVECVHPCLSTAFLARLEDTPRPFGQDHRLALERRAPAYPRWFIGDFAKALQATIALPATPVDQRTWMRVRNRLTPLIKSWSNHARRDELSEARAAICALPPPADRSGLSGRYLIAVRKYAIQRLDEAMQRMDYFQKKG